LSLSGEPVQQPQLERMIGAIRYRGPDATGYHLDEKQHVGLAHARLSIIDLATGQQPMSNRDGTIWITFNGEIFNYVELRAELVRAGRSFQTQSDTEVILQMYEAHGERCVEHFNGDLAFAIWDGRQDKLFLARDRAGVRPLFYAQTPQALIFASEIKAILAHGALDRAVDPQALDEIFTYWCTLAPRTFFAGVRELPPGHCMTVTRGRVREWAYWTIDLSPVQPIGEAEAVEALQELLTDATRIRLRSDVPVGAYLSGGLDSSVITALVNRIAGKRLRTFSVTFDDREFDESGYQQEVVRQLATEHQSVRCSYDDICDVFPQVVRHAEKPVLRTAPAPLFLLSRLVRDASFKVVLTGEGADEFLGGYDIFREAKIRQFWARQPGSNRRPLLLQRLYPYMPNLQAQPEAYRRKFFRVEAGDTASPFFSHLPRWALTARAKMFFSDDLRSRLASSDGYGALVARLPSAFAGWSPLGRAQYLEATVLLPGYILSSQGDRMAMAHSVEGRFPFLDHRVIEFANRLPPALKLKVLDEKYIVKKAFGHLVPDIVRRRPKQPYRAPDSASFIDAATRRGRRDYVEELLSPASLKDTGFFNPVAVGRLADKARNGQLIGAGDNMAFIGILSTQLLAQQFSHSSSGRTG
jgi:asparagine synthase (glutamine-hydrolysing)